MPYAIVPPDSLSEGLVEVNVSWTGQLPGVLRTPLSTSNVFCLNGIRRSYRPTLTPDDYLAHAFGAAAVQDMLLNSRELTDENTSSAPMTEEDEDSLHPVAAGKSLNRKPKRYKDPKPPPKGTFSSAVARPRSEERVPFWPAESPEALVEDLLNTAGKAKESPTKAKEDNATEPAVHEGGLGKQNGYTGESTRLGEETPTNSPSARRRSRGSESKGADTETREPYMSPVEWRAKADERLERRKLCRVKFALEGSGPNLNSSPLPLSLDGRLVSSSMGLAPPVQFEMRRVPRKRVRAISTMARTRVPDPKERKAGKENEQQEPRATDGESECLPLLRSKSLSEIDRLAQQCASIHLGLTPD